MIKKRCQFFKVTFFTTFRTRFANCRCKPSSLWLWPVRYSQLTGFRATLLAGQQSDRPTSWHRLTGALCFAALSFCWAAQSICMLCKYFAVKRFALKHIFKKKNSFLSNTSASHYIKGFQVRTLMRMNLKKSLIGWNPSYLNGKCFRGDRRAINIGNMINKWCTQTHKGSQIGCLQSRHLWLLICVLWCWDKTFFSGPSVRSAHNQRGVKGAETFIPPPETRVCVCVCAQDSSFCLKLTVTCFQRCWWDDVTKPNSGNSYRVFKSNFKKPANPPMAPNTTAF